MFDSPLSLNGLTGMPSPNSAPLEWYDLLAEDAINSKCKCMECIQDTH